MRPAVQAEGTAKEPAWNVVMILVGLALVLSSVVIVPLMTTVRVGAGESMTSGTVVDVHKGRRWSCTPEATFTVDGAIYQAPPPPMWSDCPTIGSPITVIYSTSDPREARTALTVADLVALGLVPVAGVALVALGFRMSRRRTATGP